MLRCAATEDFSRLRLDQMIDLDHPLVVLASRMRGQQIEASVAHRFARQARAGVTTTIDGTRAFHGNSCVDHTLPKQLKQDCILMQDCAVKPVTAFVDLGYRGVEADNTHMHIEHRGKLKRISPQDKRLLRRRQAIESIIGHLKADHRVDRWLPQGTKRRPAARGALRGGPASPLAAAFDCQQGATGVAGISFTTFAAGGNGGKKLMRRLPQPSLALG